MVIIFAIVLSYIIIGFISGYIFHRLDESYDGCGTLIFWPITWIMLIGENFNEWLENLYCSIDDRLDQ